MTKFVLILDLDGVLITTPLWKAGEIDSDGYSKFNEDCIANFNKLLAHGDFEICLSSSRRTKKTRSEFDQIFKNRNINCSISGFMPEYEDCRTRKDELMRLITDRRIADFLILDDDKSLNGLEEKYKEKLVLTELHKGFDHESLEIALQKIASI